MCKDKNESNVTTIRMPDRLLTAVDEYAKKYSISRTSAINSLLTDILIEKGLLE